jgi:hypothetical protein
MYIIINFIGCLAINSTKTNRYVYFICESISVNHKNDFNNL